MGNESQYSKISTGIRSQLPQIIRDKNPLYVALLEAYFEYLEVNSAVLQRGRAVQRAKQLRNYIDPDFTLDDFLSVFYKQFLSLMPRNIEVDKALLMKNIKDFYRARGTEKSFKFLIRLMSTGSNEAEFYYPKSDVLRASSSTWYVQKTLRLINMTYDGETISEANISNFYTFEGLQVTGAISGATAVVDRADHFYDNGILIDELTISSIAGQFDAGEEVTATYTDDDGIEHALAGTVNPGVLALVSVIEPGYGYSVGYEPPVETQNNSPGEGAAVRISSVTSGSVNTISVIYGGSGYRANDYLLFFSGTGIGANAYLSSVNDDGLTHPNTYTIDVSTISLEANTQIGNSVYSNLNSSNANVSIANAVSTFVYSNTGPAAFVTVLNPGNNYESVPTISAIGNTRIQSLGILGRINIIDGGLNYNVGDQLIFTNTLGGSGIGAAANVIQVAANGMIQNVAYTQVTGMPKGGWGYDNNYLPTIWVNSAIGTGATLTVAECLGSNATLTPTITSIGGILSIEVINRGIGYNSAPYINLTQSGSGTALAEANVNLGLFAYPGRYLTDSGHLSAYNFLQDRDYYQNYSYVIRVDESLSRYKAAIESLLHPAGTKLFAEYLAVLDDVNVEPNISAANVTTTAYFVPNSVEFDGASYFGTPTSEWIGATAYNNGVISVWAKLNQLPAANATIEMFSVDTGASRTKLYFQNVGTQNSATGIRVGLNMRSGSGFGNATVVYSDANSIPIIANEWIHILASWSATNTPKNKLYISNVNATFFASNAGGSVEEKAKPFIMGAGYPSTISNFFKGSISEFFMSNSYIDISDVQNRKKFANDGPCDLISTLLTNTAIIPIVYLRSPAATANLNYNTTMNSFNVVVGTFSDTPLANNPSEI